MESEEQGVYAAERLLKKRFRKVRLLVFASDLTSL
jgi:hypothetical protein